MGADEFKKQLESLTDRYSVYLNIPFCASPCGFCHYRENLTFIKSVPDSYVELLLRQLCAILPTLSTNKKLEAIHIGGGSPTLLNSFQWFKIIKFLRQFTGDTHEIAIEVKPNEWSPRLLDYNFFNRFSLGVQSLESSVFKRWHRKSTSLNEIKNIIASIKGHHRENFINIDMLIDSEIDLSEIIQVGGLNAESICYYPDTTKNTLLDYKLFQSVIERVTKNLPEYSPCGDGEGFYIFTRSGSPHSYYASMDYELGLDVLGFGHMAQSFVGEKVFCSVYDGDKYCFECKSDNRHETNIACSLPVRVEKEYLETYCKCFLPFVQKTENYYFLPKSNMKSFYKHLGNAIKGQFLRSAFYGCTDPAVLDLDKE